MNKEKDVFEDNFLQDMPIEEKPFPSEHACRLKDPGQFTRFRRRNCFRKSAGKCVDFIFGRKGDSTQVQAMRYPKKVWSVSDAKKHCKSHDGSFEAAANS